jgi:hypothetical protein
MALGFAERYPSDVRGPVLVDATAMRSLAGLHSGRV